MSPNELIPFDGANLPAEIRAELEADYKKSLDEMLDGIEARAQKIKISAGGSNNWLIGPDEDARKSFRGIIIINIKANAYWHKADNTLNPILIDTLPENYSDRVPLCSSFDGVHGSRRAETAAADGKGVTCFGECHSCYLNEYGSGVDQNGKRTKGKACKNGRRMVVYVENADIPYVLTLPPTSLKAFDDYIMTLRSKRLATWMVWTKFELESREEGQKKWSIFKPGAFEKLPMDQVAEIHQFRETYKSLVGIDFSEDEFIGSVNGDAVDAEVVDDDAAPDKPF